MLGQPTTSAKVPFVLSNGMLSCVRGQHSNYRRMKNGRTSTTEGKAATPSENRTRPGDGSSFALGVCYSPQFHPIVKSTTSEPG